jgi:hypothetical protein
MLIATTEAGRVVKKPSKPVIGAMLANLHRDDAHLVLERVEDGVEGSWYVQVLLRDDNTYQLEYRDGVAAEHYQTRTISQEKVLTAMLGWAAGKGVWRDAFMWNNIGSQFGAGEAQQGG